MNFEKLKHYFIIYLINFVMMSLYANIIFYITTYLPDLKKLTSHSEINYYLLLLYLIPAFILGYCLEKKRPPLKNYIYLFIFFLIFYDIVCLVASLFNFSLSSSLNSEIFISCNTVWVYCRGQSIFDIISSNNKTSQESS